MQVTDGSSEAEEGESIIWRGVWRTGRDSSLKKTNLASAEKAESALDMQI